MNRAGLVWLSGSLLLAACDADQATAPAASSPVRPALHALSVASFGPGSVSGPGIACGLDCNEDYGDGVVVELRPTPAAGARFEGWSGACSGTGACRVTMTSDQTVSALFELIPHYPLTVSKAGAGTVKSESPGIDCGTDCAEDYAENTVVRLGATAAGSYRFAGWSGACTGTGECSVTMTAARTVGALFEAIPSYPLTVNRSGTGSVASDPSGISCPEACSADFSEGVSVTLSATPAAGFRFDGWMGACTNASGDCRVTLSAARTVGARFTAIPVQPVHILRVRRLGEGVVTSSPAGINCGDACEKNYAEGTQVTLSAAPTAGHSFTGWSGVCSGLGACTVTMDAGKSVAAGFRADLPFVSIYPAQPLREGQVQPAPRARFEVRLTRPHTSDVTLQYQTMNGLAIAGSDYAAASGELTIPAGQRRGFISVDYLDDGVPEADEDFSLRLSTAQNAYIEIDTATGRIVDDDLAAGCDPAATLCAGAAEGLVRIPVGVPLGGYLRPPVGGEYLPGLEEFAGGDPAPFFNEFLGFIPETSEGGGANATPPNEARKSPYSTYSPSSRGYRDALLAKALALTHKGTTIVFVKHDAIGMIDEFGVEVTALVKARTGIDLGNGLIMSATHTHDGPGAIGNTSLKYFWLAIDAYHRDLFDKVVSDTADVVIAALNQRVPARFGYSSGPASDGLNRIRRTTREMIYTAPELAAQDDLRRRIGVFRVDQVDGAGNFLRPLAVMVNYAAHGIVYDVENLYFSGDCLGGLERGVQARFDAPVVVMQIQSAGGDVSPGAGGDPRRQRVERFGELLAPQVMALWNGVDNFTSTPALRVLDQRILLNLGKLRYVNNEYPYPYGAAQCNAKIGAPLVCDAVKCPNAGNAPACVAMPAPGADDLADNGVGENDAYVPQDTRLAVAQLGDAVLLTQPGEPLSEQGLRLLEGAAARGYARDKVFIWGYALDHVGYILPDLKADWLLGGTEGTTTFWGWKQGGRFLTITNGLLDALSSGAPEPADEFNLIYTHNIPSTPPPASMSPRAGVVLTQPASIRRFQTTTLLFEGGDPIIDLPTVTLEEDVNGLWMPARRVDGRVIAPFYEFWADYALTNGSHGWTIRFEPAKDFPAGRYRFRVAGKALLGPGPTPYAFSSNAFNVIEANTLRLTGLTRSGDTVEATLSYAPVPENYRLIDPVGDTSDPVPVRRGRVRFTSGGVSVEALAPLDAAAGTAIYRVTLPDNGALSASGQDIFGNRTP